MRRPSESAKVTFKTPDLLPFDDPTSVCVNDPVNMRIWNIPCKQLLNDAEFSKKQLLKDTELSKSSHQKEIWLCPGLNRAPASGMWDWSPGLVGPWAGYRVIKKCISTSLSQV